MNIYSCVDIKNIDKIFIVFTSCYLNASNSDKLKFYLLVDEEFSYDEIKNKIPIFLQNKLHIKSLNYQQLEKDGWLNINEEFSKYFYKLTTGCNHIMNFARFFIFDYFKEIDRCIYLDWDMIVRGNVLELQQYYDSNNFIVASHCQNAKMYNNTLDINHNDTNFIKKYSPNIFAKINYLRPYIDKNFLISPSFNAGFYIVSKSDFNEIKLKSVIKNLIVNQKQNNNLIYGTQTILNFLTYPDINFVDKKWNTFTSNRKEIKDNFKIFHWNRLEKPWITKDPIWLEYFNIYNNFIKLNKEKELLILN